MDGKYLISAQHDTEKVQLNSTTFNASNFPYMMTKQNNVFSCMNQCKRFTRYPRLKSIMIPPN